MWVVNICMGPHNIRANPSGGITLLDFASYIWIPTTTHNIMANSRKDTTNPQQTHAHFAADRMRALTLRGSFRGKCNHAIMRFVNDNNNNNRLTQPFERPPKEAARYVASSKNVFS